MNDRAEIPPLAQDAASFQPAIFRLSELFVSSHDPNAEDVVRCGTFARVRLRGSDSADRLVDLFANHGIQCASLRTPVRNATTATFALERGGYGLHACSAGGWLLKPAEQAGDTYWIPQPPVVRTIDAHGRIRSEHPTKLAAFSASSAGVRIELVLLADGCLDGVVWRFPAAAADIVEGLERPLVLEMQPLFMWGSHTAWCGPADVYRYLVHGHVYENRYEWRYKWKICAENEAYSIYVALHGLERASDRSLYGLLKRQLVLSVLSRQAEDGGWHHGEWSDFMESHFRLHNGAVLLLEAAFEEYRDEAIGAALAKAAAFTARHTDDTRLGLWFLHDSLEENLELLHKSGSRLIPSRILGKSPSNKLILNTHLDSIVVLDRYREIAGDDCYADQVASARTAMRGLLALRPAEALYGLVAWAVRLTHIPPSRAEQLAAPVRAARRAAREYVLPRLHRLKRRFPRVVMPGGLIERHLGMPHYDVNYQTINLMDLVRVWRRFPDEDLSAVVSGAIAAVHDTSLLEYWRETRQKGALGYWVEALYQLCTLDRAGDHRALLAEAMAIATEAGLGLTPSLLGGNPEVARPADRTRCPSPLDARLRVANLSRAGKRELLVVNCSRDVVNVAWESAPEPRFVWSMPDGRAVSSVAACALPPRGWLSGRQQLR